VVQGLAAVVVAERQQREIKALAEVDLSAAVEAVTVAEVALVVLVVLALVALVAQAVLAQAVQAAEVLVTLQRAAMHQDSVVVTVAMAVAAAAVQELKFRQLASAVTAVTAFFIFTTKEKTNG
jgi:hypothetical protein